MCIRTLTAFCNEYGVCLLRGTSRFSKHDSARCKKADCYNFKVLFSFFLSSRLLLHLFYFILLSPEGRAGYLCFNIRGEDSSKPPPPLTFKIMNRKTLSVCWQPEKRNMGKKTKTSCVTHIRDVVWLTYEMSCDSHTRCHVWLTRCQVWFTRCHVWLTYEMLCATHIRDVRCDSHTRRQVWLTY
jgi:hypothetical protein